MAKRTSKLTKVTENVPQQAAAANRRRESLDEARQGGPGAANEPPPTHEDVNALPDPHAGDKDDGGLAIGSFTDRAAAAKASAEALTDPFDQQSLLNHQDDLGSGGAGDGSGGGSGSNFNPIAAAQNSVASSGKEPGQGGPSVENQASDTSFNRRLSGAHDAGGDLTVGADFFVRDFGDSSETTSKGKDSVITESQSDTEKSKEERHFGEDGTIDVVTTTTETINADGSVTTTTEVEKADGSSSTTSTTTAPPPSTPSTGDPGDPDDQPVVPQSDFDPTGKSGQGGDVDGNEEEIKFAVSTSAKVPEHANLDLLGNPGGPDFGTGPSSGEAPSGSTFNDPNAVDPTDDTPDNTHSGPEDDPLDHSTGDPLEPTADTDTDDDDSPLLLHARVAATHLNPADLDDLKIADLDNDD